jgi:predicted protein tyrosine phosphatase
MLVVSGLNWARRHKREFDAVLTVEDPDIGRWQPPTMGSLRFHRHPAPAHLVLRFYDLDYPLPSPFHQPWMRLASPDDVRAALDFAVIHDRLLIHCKAGISRSTALALAVLTQQYDDPEAALQMVLALQPNAVPNRHVIVLADELLQCNGKLLETVDAWDQSVPSNARRRWLCRLAHYYEFGVPRTEFVNDHPEAGYGIDHGGDRSPGPDDGLGA